MLIFIMANPIQDAFTGSSQQEGSLQDQYYRYMLLKEKLGARNRGQDILTETSEEEEIRYQILEKINKIKESTPEYDSLVALTGGERDKFKQAEKIAKVVWEAELSKKKLAMFAPKKDDVRDIYDQSNDHALGLRIQAKQGKKPKSSATVAVEAVSSALGLAPAPASTTG